MVPPPLLDEAAVNNTELPTHTGPAGLAVRLTAGVMFWFTIIIMLLEPAVVGDTQFALEVMITVTISPLANEAEVYAEAFVPTLIPFTCH